MVPLWIVETISNLLGDLLMFLSWSMVELFLVFIVVTDFSSSSRLCVILVFDFNVVLALG